MKTNKKKYGIHLRTYCTDYEETVLSRLNTGQADDALLKQLELKISWLQHERLVHLIVTMLISILFLFSIALYIALQDPLILILIAFSLVLLVPYIRHYFFLENRVQSWYKLYDELYCSIKKAAHN
jgi:hypothetical protein